MDVSDERRGVRVRTAAQQEPHHHGHPFPQMNDRIYKDLFNHDLKHYIITNIHFCFEFNSMMCFEVYGNLLPNATPIIVSPKSLKNLHYEMLNTLSIYDRFDDRFSVVVVVVVVHSLVSRNIPPATTNDLTHLDS